MHGHETFKDGETESHIKIELPTAPQQSRKETFTVALGQPSGGSTLHDLTECRVNVTHDVMCGKIEFEKSVVKVVQTDGDVIVPLKRSFYTEGKVKVGWRTITESSDSPFANLSGVETFEDGEKESNIEIAIKQLPRDSKQDSFDVVLSPPSTTTVSIDESERCSVVVKNNIANARLSFAQASHEVEQSEGKLQLKVNRDDQLRGEIILPWKVVPQSPDSVYVGMRGETILKDGSDEGMVVVALPQLPLPEERETIVVILDHPLGAPAVLADECICQVTVRNDLGEGVIEMKSNEMAASSQDGEANVVVLRKLADEFPAEVAWSAQDGDALFNTHYTLNKGVIRFRSGEKEKRITIPLLNDPAAQSRRFTVKLDRLDGRDRMGDKRTCAVVVSNEAVAPLPVTDLFVSVLNERSVVVTWNGADDVIPVTGYVISYWKE